MGARRLPGYLTYQQGSGLIRIGKAWGLLREYHNRPAVKLSFSAPIRSPLARYLKVQQGVGLYENGGWSVGEHATHLVKIFRSGGSPSRLRCRLELIGNDGTFAVPNSADLSAGRETKIPVQIQISTAGVHDAILRVVDAQTDLPLDQTALTIVVGNALGPQNGYTFDLHGELRPEESKMAFVEVPSGTSVLKVQIRVLKGNVHLYGEAPSFLGGWIPLKQYLYPSQWTHSEPQPEPGVWQFRIDDFEHNYMDRKHFLSDAEYTLHIEAQGPEAIPKLDKNSDFFHGVGMQFATIPNPELIHRRGFLQRTFLTPDASPSVFKIEIPKRTEFLFLGLEAKEHRGGQDADFYLYNCNSAEKDHACKLWEIRTLRDGSTSFFVRWPEEGLWKLLIDPLSPRPAVGLQLSEVLVGPAPGRTALLAQDPARSSEDVPIDQAAESAAVNFVEVIDPVSEREEEISPLLDLTHYPSSDFLPVPVGIGFSHQQCWQGSAGQCQ
jgi:hypothetical protein